MQKKQGKHRGNVPPLRLLCLLLAGLGFCGSNAAALPRWESAVRSQSSAASQQSPELSAELPSEQEVASQPPELSTEFQTESKPVPAQAGVRGAQRGFGAEPQSKNKTLEFSGGTDGRNKPVLLSADQLGYDRRNAQVIAQGHVEVVQGDTIVLADRITYSQNTNEVFAQGNVSLRQSTGDVAFADAVRLKDNLQAGLINNFRARMSDNSLFAAREARKYGKDVTELDYAVYSPCKVCADKDPLWQLKAEKVRVDNIEQKVTYRNAKLEMWGLPVAWTPYFSHATPDADPKSGFLAPEIGADSLLGTTLKTPYYYNVSPQMDVTITPAFYTKEVPALFGEGRYLHESGSATIRASATDPHKRDGNGKEVSGNEFRGHIDANGRFKATEAIDWGFDIRRASDDTYMRRYNISQVDLLTSRVFGEAIDGRSFASVQGLAFQRLTNEANPNSSPLVLPMGDVWWQGDPGWMGSRTEFTANTMLLTRSEGPQSRRVSMNGGWSLPMLAPGGHVLETGVNLRGDLYNVADVLQSSGERYAGTTGRLIPEWSAGWRYPVVNEYAPGRSLLLEPVANVMVSPEDVSSGKIPIEDSQVLEYNDNNLFDSNHYVGYDLVETGPRANYGMRGLWQFADTDYFNFLLGQNFRSSNDNRFPFTDKLTDNFSDYAGKFGVDLDTWLMAAYRFRLDRDGLAPRRQEFNTRFTFNPVSLQVDYIKLTNDPFLGDRQEIFSYGNFDMTEQWALLASARRNLNADEMIDATGGVRYHDECFSALATFGRSFINTRDVQPSSSFMLRVEFKNLE